MLSVFNTQDGKAGMKEETHLKFVRACEAYIGELKSGGHLLAAQPLLREGITIQSAGESWSEVQIASTDIQVGYYHLRAENIDQAIELAKGNPEFAYVPGASIKIQPIKTREAETGFVSPK